MLWEGVCSGAMSYAHACNGNRNEIIEHWSMSSVGEYACGRLHVLVIVWKF